jgi:hypothetical protein
VKKKNEGLRSTPMKKETQRHEGQLATRSLPPHRVPSQSGTNLEKTQDPDFKLKRRLRRFHLLKPEILWMVVILAAIISLFHPFAIQQVAVFVILVAVAAGYITLPRAIDLLQRLLLPGSPRAQEQGDQKRVRRRRNRKRQHEGAIRTKEQRNQEQ